MTMFKKITDWEVLTPNGWSNFDAISKLQKLCYIKIVFDDGSWIECSENHKMKLISNEFIYAKNIKRGMVLLGKEKNKIVKSKRKINKKVDLYDLNNVEKNREFYSNDVISHNCALIEEADELWTSAQPSLSTGGNCIILSCVAKNTMVITTDGIKEIGDFVDASKIGGYETKSYDVMGVNKVRRGNLLYNNGKQKTNIIRTKFSELECTGNHKLWAYKKKDAKFGWYQSSDLDVGDYLSIQYGKQLWGNNDSVDNFVSSKSNKIHSPLEPKILTPLLCYLLGLYISEGSTYKVINKNGILVGGNLTITCGDDISWIFDELNLTYSCWDKLHYTVSNKNLIEFMEYLGFDLSVKAHKKYIPARLLLMSETNIKWLLKGIFDGDGCARNRGVKLTSTSKKLIDQVRIILSNFGILAGLVLETKEALNSRNGKIKHNNDAYNLEIYGRYALQYYNRIGFNLERKQKYILESKTQNLNRACSRDVIPNTLELAYMLIKSSELSYSEIKEKCGVSVKHYASSKMNYKTVNISRENIISLYSLFSENLSLELQEYWDRIVGENIVWCEITSMNESENETFDFSLPEDVDDYWCHSVIYNGVIGHQTPRGIGGLFHQLWQGAEENFDGKVGKNGFHPISLPWNLHPERDAEWRRVEGEKQGSPKKASQEFDCVWLSSGESVVDLSIIEFYKKTYMRDPVDVRGADKGLWIWEYPSYGIENQYIISGDVARGNGADFSAAHVLDISGEMVKQVAEYRGSFGTKDFGNFLVGLATEYNNALLIVERESYGWATLTTIIERQYKNLFYSSADLKYVDVQRQLTNKYDSEDKKLVPGFSTNLKTRPLIISNMEQYFREKAIVIYSKRTLGELETFIWKNGKPQAMSEKYNDDLVLSLCIGLWVRDTALRLRLQGIELTKAGLGKIAMNKMDEIPVYKQQMTKTGQDMWRMKTGRQGFGNQNNEDLRWLIS